MQDESSNLEAWSTAVRESSLKRLRLVPVGWENWRPIPGAMSFTEIARHILNADIWLFRKLEDPALPALKGSANSADVANRKDYIDILRNLERTGHQRSDLIQRLTQEQLAHQISDERFGGKASVWWVIVRGNLDHEVHHRGQLAVYLRIAKLTTP